MYSKLAIEMQQDDYGWFAAVIIDADDDSVVWITAAHRTEGEARQAAYDKIDRLSAEQGARVSA